MATVAGDVLAPAPATADDDAALKRVDSKMIKATNEYSGYIAGDYDGVVGYFRNLWRNNFVSRLTRVVGLNFVIVTFILYGVQQGGVHAFNELGRVYAYKDRGYEPAETQRAIAWTDMRWVDSAYYYSPDGKILNYDSQLVVVALNLHRMRDSFRLNTGAAGMSSLYSAWRSIPCPYLDITSSRT